MIGRRVFQSFIHSRFSNVRGTYLVINNRFLRQGAEARLITIPKDPIFTQISSIKSLPTSEALQAIDISDNKLELYETALEKPSKLGKIVEVEEILKSLTKNGVKPNLKMYHSIILAYNQAKKLSKMQEHLTKLKEQGLVGTTEIYELFITTHASRGDERAMYSVFSEMNQNKVNISPKIYGLLIDHSRDKNSYDKISTVLEHAKANENNKNLATVYSHVVYAYAFKGDVQTIKKLFEEMKARNIYVRPAVERLLNQYFNTERYSFSIEP